jgi:hypothetical protein
MVTIIFLGGVVTGLVIGWLGLVLLTFATLKKRKRYISKF